MFIYLIVKKSCFAKQNNDYLQEIRHQDPSKILNMQVKKGKMLNNESYMV
jgi:hypothetical protein